MKKKVIRLTESDLHKIITESVHGILSETELNYDIDNFSGRWNKSEPDYNEYVDQEGYLDNPMDKDEIEMNLLDDNDDYFTNAKDIENDYSWNEFDNKSIAQGLDDYYKVSKKAVPGEVNYAIKKRNKDKDWSDRELNTGRRMMKKWVNGERDAEQVGDSWEDVQYLRNH